jgi:hypothetical protein
MTTISLGATPHPTTPVPVEVAERGVSGLDRLVALAKVKRVVKQVRVRVESVPCVLVLDGTAEGFEAMRARHDRTTKDGDVKDMRFAAMIVAAKTLEILDSNGVAYVDEDGALITFRHPDLLKSLGASNAADAVLAFLREEELLGVFGVFFDRVMNAVREDDPLDQTAG